MHRRIHTPKSPRLDDPSALKSQLLAKDRKIMELVDKLEIQRRIAERGLIHAQAGADPFEEGGAEHESYIDIFQHMLDELTRSTTE